MSILTFPDVAIAQVKFSLISRSQAMESELNGSIQTGALPGDYWQAQFTVVDLMGRDARLFSAFVNSLRGRQGRFYLSPPGCGTPLGTALGTGLVQGAGQTGSTLVTDGWTANQAELFAIGDFFQVGSELKQITATAASSAGGVSTLTFTPPLRSSPADNAAIVKTNPVCIMMAADDNQGSFDLSGPRIYAFNFSCREPIA
jgi:hypothetical protein